jgi:multiple sugar transport system ATP-binding protein
MTMGTRIVVMKDGIIQQVDSPTNIYQNPVNMFVAGFIGSPQMNFINGSIVKKGSTLYFKFGATELPLPADKAKVVEEKGYAGKEVVFGIRPEDIDDSAEYLREYASTTVDAKVEVIEHMGSETYLFVVVEDTNMVARVEPTSKAVVDQTVKLGFNINKIHIFDKETELTII